MKTGRRLDRKESKLRPLYPESGRLLVPTMPCVNYKISALGGEITNSSHSEHMNYTYTLLWAGTAMGLPQLYLYASPLSSVSPFSEHHFFILPNIGLSFLLSYRNVLFSFTAFTPTQNYVFIHLPKRTGTFIYILYMQTIFQKLWVWYLILVSCHPNKLFSFHILYIRKQRHKEVLKCDNGHSASQWRC